MYTPEQIRNKFFKDGYSIASWVKDNNFPVDLVYKVLRALLHKGLKG
ncbi:hypothetical protein [Acinetobacter sp. ANC 4973]|nr:hypothetical protein [Acinetobacter sp. ANC 4973]OTG94069.1 hypothetical protein B9T30_15930 [Acinetobacter sp. ANC 4973]